jgi:ABC-type protease/lipase transport system fused ATPase/permease subunit
MTRRSATARAASGGQRQRTELRAHFTAACGCRRRAEREPDGEGSLAAASTLKAFGVTVILVGHRPSMVSQLDKLAVLKDGALEAFGPTAEVLPRLRAGARQAPRLTTVVTPAPAEAQA